MVISVSSGLSLAGATLTLLCALVTGACAFQESVIYPANWPTVTRTGRCADVSGRYFNQAVDSTRAADTGTRVPSHGFLATVLEDGSLGYFDTSQLRISSIQFNVEKNEFAVYHESNSSGLSRTLQPGWTCNAAGAFALELSEKVDSEGSVGSVATTRVELSAAADGSMIAHLIVETQASFPPGIVRRESWARFRRLP